MTNKSDKKQSDLASEMSKLVAEQRKQSKHFQEQNRLAQEQIEQSQLKIEQTERLYLLEKSKLQPKFKLSVTEFLLCEPDFMADPEQASEAKFLTDLGASINARVLRFQISVLEKGQYLRPRLVISRDEKANDKGLNGEDLAFSMSERLYFLPFDLLSNKNDLNAFSMFWIYHDQTTLPVIQKYIVNRQQNSKLKRWNVAHEDTVFALAKHSSESLSVAADCNKLFENRF